LPPEKGSSSKGGDNKSERKDEDKQIDWKISCLRERVCVCEGEREREEGEQEREFEKCVRGRKIDK
jgi:hypothetical protein